MNKRRFFQTKIKRSHLVLQNGVGALVRSRQGVTAVVAGLPEWDHFLRKWAHDDPTLHDQYLRSHWFREPELETATGVHRFVPPPSEQQNGRTWELPLLRFPMAGVCSNWQCQRVTIASHGSPHGRSWRCTKCAGARNFLITQVPIFYACPRGHLEEIDFAGLIEHLPGCSAAIPKVAFGNRVESPFVTCDTCGGKGSPAAEPCSGGRPWLPMAGPEPCDESMEVVSRTSVKVYYAQTRSAIHIPLEANYNDELLRWLENNPAYRSAVAFDTDEERRNAGQALIDSGWNVSLETAIEHIHHFRSAVPQDENDWHVLESRAREFDILSGRRHYPALDSSPLISLSRRGIGEYSNQLVAGGLITGVTAVHKLTETRVINGFSRITPRVVPPRDGRMLMWGRDTGPDDWLPGYRTHGEGIFIEFDASRFRSQGASEADDGRSLFMLSEAGVAVHTFAHLLIGALAESAGYSVPSIRDRVYDVANGRLGVLVYTAEGDSMGTLGGLVEQAEPELFGHLIEMVVDRSSWCPQDPVCSETVHSAENHIGAACHQCTLLPETSCELFNSFLDRNTVADLSSATNG